MSKGGIDLRTLSDANRIHVLKIIHEQKSISRTELAGMTGLSLSAVSRIVKQLIEDGFVLETGYGDSSGGRKHITIRVNPLAGYVIGVDFSKTKANAGVFNFCGEMIFQYVAPIHGRAYLDGLYEAIDNCVAFLHAKERLMLIYCGVRGLIDSNTGTILSSTTFGWENIPLRQLLTDRYSVPVGLDINARLAALGEWKTVYDDSVDDLVYVTTSWGICAGVISHRELFRGGWGMAGEIGNTINFTGEGNPFLRNLEESCGGQMLIRRAQESWGAQDNFLLRKLTGDCADKVTVEDIVAAANSGDAFAVRLAREAAAVLALGLFNVVYIYNPKVVVIGGLLSEMGDIVLEPIKKILRQRLPELIYRQLKVELTVLGSRASLVGAAEAAFHVIFTSPIGDPHGHNNMLCVGT